MAKAQPAGVDSYMTIDWPFKGIQHGSGLENQMPGSCIDSLNVRNFNLLDRRRRGCPREGITKMFAGQVSGAHPVQCLGAVTAISSLSSGDLNPRKLYGVAVADGDVKYWVIGTDTSFQSPTNGTNALNTTAPVIFCAEHSQKLFFADGDPRTTHVPRYLDTADNTVKSWEGALTAGTLPIDVSSNTPRLICTWRGRLVLSGLLKDGQNWFMSAVNNPFDFDYSPADETETQAVAGNASPAGKIGDVVTGLIPASDDTLYFLCDHTVWRMSGDPMAGGRIDLVSDQVGGYWGAAWTKDNKGNVYFYGTQGGIFMIPRGETKVERLSQGIDYKTATDKLMMICMLWNENNYGLHVYRTYTDVAIGVTLTHLTNFPYSFFFDTRETAWWLDDFAERNHLARCTMVQDGDDPADRKLLLGCGDGYVRYLDPTAVTDDATAMVTFCIMGPIKTAKFDAFLWKEMQAAMALDQYGRSEFVTWKLYLGNNCENALYETIPNTAAGTFQLRYRQPDLTGAWFPGQNRPSLIRREFTAAYLLITGNGGDWRFERCVAKLRKLGMVRSRQVRE